jgi:Zn-dependent metalloprotease
MGAAVVEYYRKPCFFIPPQIESRLNPKSHETTQKLRMQRIFDVQDGHRRTFSANVPSETKFRVYNAKHEEQLPGSKLKLVLDPEAKRALEGSKKVISFYKEVFGRDSIDNRNMSIDSTVHYGEHYANAFWNSRQMVYGDGDKTLVTFTQDLDVIGHEFTHGVDEYTINLAYENQSGALNESLSDMFGIMIKQHDRNQTVLDSDWLIGDIMIPDKPGKTRKAPPVKQALRSMKDEPAYDLKALGGKDDQPKKMGDYKDLPNDENNDWGGVHTNSGIPNHWFYLASMEVGGHSWEKMGKVVYNVMEDRAVTPNATFVEFANATIASAKQLFGKEDSVVKAVHNAWITTQVLR